MRLDEVLGDETLRQREFPVCRDQVFLAHAAVCPLPRRVTQAMQDYLAQTSRMDQDAALPPGWVDETRELAARLIQAKPQEIALVGPTSLALSLIASGLDWRKHDNVLMYQDDYPSNVYPWMALAERKVQVRMLQTRELGRIELIDIMTQVDEHTRLVALSSCHFVSGYRIDLPAIGSYLRKRGIAFCVDGIQTVGAMPTLAHDMDFLAADAHKWLLGPCAAGLMYVRESWQESLRPPVYGWHNVRCPNFVAQDELRLRQDARRYEAGTANLVGLAGLRASLEMLLEVGVEEIGRELQRKRTILVEGLQRQGCRVLHASADPGRLGPMTAFDKEGEDMGVWHRRLAEKGVMTSLRQVRSGQSYLRVSPHFYNTDEELCRFLEML